MGFPRVDPFQNKCGVYPVYGCKNYRFIKHFRLCRFIEVVTAEIVLAIGCPSKDESVFSVLYRVEIRHERRIVQNAVARSYYLLSPSVPGADPKPMLPGGVEHTPTANSVCCIIHRSECHEPLLLTIPFIRDKKIIERKISLGSLLPSNVELFKIIIDGGDADGLRRFVCFVGPGPPGRCESPLIHRIHGKPVLFCWIEMTENIIGPVDVTDLYYRPTVTIFGLGSEKFVVSEVSFLRGPPGNGHYLFIVPDRIHIHRDRRRVNLMGFPRPFISKAPVIGNSDPEPVLMGGIKIFPPIGGCFGIGDNLQQLLFPHLSVRMEDLVGKEIFLSGPLPLYGHLLKVVADGPDGNRFW